MNLLDRVLENNLVPDSLIRIGINKLLKKRLAEYKILSVDAQKEKFMKLISELRNSPIAVNTSDANEQHYEVPTEFFKIVLGTHLKYSSGYWDNQTISLDQAEENMLKLTCKRASIKDGEDILELGCGWGSLTLFMAKNYPNSRITAVSNSRTQKEFIEDEAEKQNLTNITLITEDMNNFNLDKKFDRVISVEMFEHMRNYSQLFNKISNMLKPEGELFVHIFTHKNFSYLFEVRDDSDWMSKYFFTGGIMPSDHLLLYFANNFEVENHWIVNGKHYSKTANAWLKNMDSNKKSVIKLFEKTYGKTNAVKWWAYWRIFFMACEELWNFKNGNEWFVSHYLFRKVK